MKLQTNKKRTLLANAVNGALGWRGTNLQDWARSHNYIPSTVWRALHCGHRGKISRNILATIHRDLLDGNPEFIELIRGEPNGHPGRPRKDQQCTSSR